MTPITILGLAAGGLNILSSLPQILHTIRRKQTADISLHMYILLFTGTSLWLVYGFITNQLALLITNGIYFVFTIIILCLKIKYG